MSTVFAAGRLSRAGCDTLSGMSTSGAPPDRCTAGDIDEARLLAGLRAGDTTAFEELVSACSGRMLVVALRLLRNEEDALDTVQDAFLSAFRALGSFEGGARLSTWLHRIVVNKAIMKLRTRQCKPEESIDELLPKFLEDGHHAQPVAAWKETAEVALQRQETHALVRKCIDRLPETYRMVLLLRDIEELDTEETAQFLGVSPSAVKIRLHRACLALRTLLNPHFQQGAV
jgi:RNA polymerase sigma-70 factor, ECF subfamily